MFQRALLILIASVAICAGQPEPAASPFMVRVWTSEDGLPGNVVRSVDQAPDGLLWVATAEGVASFDGYRFHPVSLPDEADAGIVSYFRVFAVDDGNVWVSTHDGQLYRVSEPDHRLEKVELDLAPGDTSATSIVVSHDGGTYLYRARKFWVLTDNGARPLGSPTRELWTTLEQAKTASDQRGRAPDNRLSPTLLVDHDGGRWEIEDARLSYQPPASDAGETRDSDARRKFTASDLLEDREGNLWIASPVDGLFRVRHRRVRNLAVGNGSYNQPPTTALLARDGTWWIARRDGMIDRIRDGRILRHPLTGSGLPRTASCLFEDSDGGIWVATRDGALKQWDEEAQDLTAHFTRIPHFSKIRAIAEDSDGRMWFGGLRGLFRVDGGEVEDFSEDPAIRGAAISELSIAGGTVYLGTGDGRFLSYDGSRFSDLGPAAGHPQQWISAIVPVDGNEVWVSTLGDGLHLLRNGRWHRFGNELGLPDDRLTALTLVGDREFWMGSLSGIIRVSRDELLESLEGENDAPGWLLLDRSDGMINRECIGRSQPGIVTADDGTLWFPTSAGLAGVRPERIALNDTPPTVHFAPVEINGIPHPVSGAPLTAGPGRTRLTFGYSGISLTEPEKITYHVRLVGLDDDSQYLGHERRISYQAVPPGHYRFEVTAINGDGAASIRPASIPIIIRPHFWQTPWFVTLATLSAIAVTLGLGALITRYRMRRRIRELRVQQMLENERARISRDLHDELGASLTQLSIISALANEDPDDEKLRPSLGTLTTKAQQAVGELDEIVWATNPSQDSLRSLVEYLDFFVHEYLKTVRVPVQCSIQPDIRDAEIGPRRRHNVVLATREAINNAVKHASPTVIHVEVSEVEGELVVRISDDGTGFDVGTASGGEGLRNLRRRMTDCGGDFVIESRPGHGCTVTLSLPIPT